MISAMLRWENPTDFFRAVAWLTIGTPVVFTLTRWVRGWVSKNYSQQQGLIAGKLVFYPGLAIVLITALQQLGFSLTPLLGAAGIVGIAVGFASQTSVSNVISGFFLIAERPFQVDDVIQVGSTVGRVLSIDTLSVKLRTFDNRFIRIPNETIVKSEVVTITRFPIRRLDLNVGVAYKENIPRVRETLMELARANPKSLMQPAPVVFFDGYGDSSLDLRLTVWTTRENFWDLKRSLLEEIKAAFDEAGIEIPFPHRSLYVGSATDPFPVTISSAAPIDEEEEREPDSTEPDVQDPAPSADHDDPDADRGSRETKERPK
ncbi:MAG: mechanosensitive ion channel family protein [Gemmatimonadales bacterium]|nr:MAG: mechanosensitive ion channel family protein [Gemmatimonadales bacterium]